MRKALLLLPLLLLVLAGAALAGTWLWAANALERGYTAWLQERRAEGYRFENATAELGGFPFRLTADLQQPSVAAPQGWSWQAPDVSARAEVLDPFTVRFTAPGRHEVTTINGRELVAEADAAKGRVLFTQEGARSAQITLNQVALDGLPVGATAAPALFVALGPRRRPDDAPQELEFTLEADALELPAKVETPFGRTIDHLRARGTAVGALPRQMTPESLQAWRTRGGQLQVQHLELDWAPMEVAGNGDLTLDERLRPQGELSVQISGLGAALDKLAATGAIDPRAVSYAKLAISALGQTDDATGKTRVDVPLSFREGRLFLGPVPLLRLRPVLPAAR